MLLEMVQQPEQSFLAELIVVRKGRMCFFPG